MNLVAILFAVMLFAPAPTGPDPARRVSVSEPVQDASAQEANPQQPAADPPKEGTDNKSSEENKKEEAQPEKKAEEPSSHTAPNGSQPPSARKRRPRTTKRTSLTSDDEPRKIVIHRGGTSEPITQILPGMSQEEADRQRDSAEQLLVAAESGLKELAVRTLNTNQQETVIQVRHYMDIARSALKGNDIQRAHTLALKAYLLSDDLLKHP